MGQAQAKARGLKLVDTKYEFGRIGDELILIDEIHTPDSSRFWEAAGDETSVVEVPAWSALLAARRMRLPFVTTYHGAYSETNPLKRAYNGVMARGDVVIANSRWMSRPAKKGEAPRFGGIVYTESAEKTAYFIENCDRHDTPLLFVQDVSGFMVGQEAEASGIIRAGARFVEAMACARVPKIVLTINHASGAGYYAMAGQGFDPDFIFSLPTGRMGVMEGDSAVQAIFGTQLEKLKKEGKSPDEKLLAEMEKVRQTYDRELDAKHAAARGLVVELAPQ